MKCESGNMSDLRIDSINAILPELNDIQEQLSKSYKILNSGEQVTWLRITMATIHLRADAVENQINRLYGLKG